MARPCHLGVDERLAAGSALRSQFSRSRSLGPQEGRVDGKGRVPSSPSLAASPTTMAGCDIGTALHPPRRAFCWKEAPAATITVGAGPFAIEEPPQAMEKRLGIGDPVIELIRSLCRDVTLLCRGDPGIVLLPTPSDIVEPDYCRRLHPSRLVRCPNASAPRRCLSCHSRNDHASRFSAQVFFPRSSVPRQRSRRRQPAVSQRQLLATPACVLTLPG